jgi:hypothetical protein
MAFEVTTVTFHKLNFSPSRNVVFSEAILLFVISNLLDPTTTTPPNPPSLYTTLTTKIVLGYYKFVEL